MDKEASENLPKSWERVQLGEVVDIIRGISFPKTVKSLQGNKDSIACLRTANVQKEVDWNNLIFVPSKYVNRKDQFVIPFDILISIANSLELVGKVALVKKVISEATIGAFIAIMRVSKELVKKFIYYQLSSFDVQSSIRLIASATVNISNVSTSKLSSLQIKIPPILEQERIVKKIEELFSDLDAGVEALEQVLEKLKLYRAAVLKAAVEGALTAEWRQRHPHTEHASELLKRILVERRRRWEAEQLRIFKERCKDSPQNWKTKYKEPDAPDTANLPPLPEGWCWASWGQIGVSQNGRPFPSKEYIDSGIKLLRPGNLYADGSVGWNDKNTRFMPERYARNSSDLIIEGEELVINLTAQSLKDEFLGRVCLTKSGEKCLLNQRLARLTPILIPSKYMLCVFKSSHFRKFVDELNTGSLIQHMFTSQLEKYVLPLPPLLEQEVIVEAVEEQLSMIYHLEAELDTMLQSAQALRQAILKKAFSGNLVPQDPEDEPAADLLERIKAEKAGHTAGRKPGRRAAQRDLNYG